MRKALRQQNTGHVELIYTVLQQGTKQEINRTKKTDELENQINSAITTNAI